MIIYQMLFIKTVSEQCHFPPFQRDVAHLSPFEEVKTLPMYQIITVCTYSEEKNTF